MQQAKSVFPIFLIFFIVSIFIFFFFQSPLLQPLQAVTLPIQKWVFGTDISATTLRTPQDKLQEENNALRIQLAKLKEIEMDNQALRSQFELNTPPSKDLLPAGVVGVSNDTLMIDKGSSDAIKVGDIVIVKDNLVGNISKVTPHISIIKLVSHPSTSFTAITIKTKAIGVVRSQGSDSIYLDNVVLSDKLENDDLVITKGDIDSDGNGFPPDLIVGKVASVNKKASNLFQQAKIKSLIEIAKLRIVFVIRK